MNTQGPQVSRDAPDRPAQVFAIALVALLVLIAAGSYADQTLGSAGSATTDHRCDQALEDGLGLQTTQGVCLEDVQVAVSSANQSDFVVPVMLMKPGSTTTLDILYLLGSESVGHKGPIMNVTAADLPVALTVPSGKLTHLVVFSNARPLFAGRGFIAFRYTLTVSSNSTGYYAILPPLYFGTYPALAVGANPFDLNMTTLRTWGYDGVMQSAEFALPSEIVGTGTLTVVNATVPTTPACASPACIIVSHSGT